MYKAFFKRFLDILISAAALLLLWWLMAIAAVAVRLESPGPAVFRQQRRATSIDELPQLWNILKGDMSLIGPRPPLTYHPWPVEQYTDFQRRMFEVRPGITGWAQIHGRKDVEWHRRIELNVWYVDHLSFALDVKIFFLTIWKVLSNADNENVGATVVSNEDKPRG